MKNRGQGAKAAVCLATALCLASCDSSQGTPPPDPVATSGAPLSDSGEPAQISSLPQLPPHNFIGEDRSAYLYQAEISENDKKAGKAAGDVLSFAYLGLKKGKYVLVLVDNNLSILEHYYCTRPCIAIEKESGGKIAYDEKSLVGAAFSDAIAGTLATAVEKRSSAEDSTQSRLLAVSPYRPLPRYNDLSPHSADTPIRANDEDYTPAPAAGGDSSQ